MPHVKYSPKPRPRAPVPEMNRAPLTSVPVQPDLPLSGDGFLDEFPLPNVPKQANRPPVAPGAPRRREKRRSGCRPGLSRISMKSYTVSPESVLKALTGES